VTTISITEVKLSKQNDQLTCNESIKIHGIIVNLYETPVVKILKKRLKDIKKEITRLKQVIIHTPVPRYLPNKLPLKKPSKGKISIRISIWKIYINIIG